jgi:hypothetical protein
VFNCECKGVALDLSVLFIACAASSRMGEILAISCPLCSKNLRDILTRAALQLTETCSINDRIACQAANM